MKGRIDRRKPSTLCDRTERAASPASPLAPLLPLRKVGGVFRSQQDRVPICSAGIVHTLRSNSDLPQIKAFLGIAVDLNDSEVAEQIKKTIPVRRDLLLQLFVVEGS